MSNIIETLKGFISPELVAQTSSSLGESSGNVTSALSSAFPSILGGLLNKSSDPHAMGGFLDMAKKQSGQEANISSGGFGDSGILERGKNFIGSLFGNKSNDVANAIGSSSGVKSSSASSILAMAAPIVMGFFGSKARSGNFGVSNMVGMLKDQKDNIMTAMPSGVSNLLGGVKKENSSNLHAHDYRRGHETKSTNWVKYLVYAAIAGLFIFIISRSCSRDATQNEVKPMENTQKGTRPTSLSSLDVDSQLVQHFELNLK